MGGGDAGRRNQGSKTDEIGLGMHQSNSLRVRAGPPAVPLAPDGFSRSAGILKRKSTFWLQRVPLVGN